MESNKALTMFAGIAALSVGYYFVVFMPSERRNERMRRDSVRSSYELCLTNAAASSDQFLHDNGGQFSANGLRVSASSELLARAKDVEKDAQRLCSDEYPASSR